MLGITQHREELQASELVRSSLLRIARGLLETSLLANLIDRSRTLEVALMNLRVLARTNGSTLEHLGVEALVALALLVGLERGLLATLDAPLCYHLTNTLLLLTNSFLTLAELWSLRWTKSRARRL